MSTAETMNAHRTCCTECKRPMRPRRTPLENYPGTVLLECKGMCASCYRAHRAEESAGPKKPPALNLATTPVLDSARVVYLSMERAKFEMSRRNRHIPETGAKYVRLALTNRFLPLNQEVAA